MIGKIATVFLAFLFFSCNHNKTEWNLAGRPIPVFQNGADGYNCFRIPAIVQAVNGDLIAFAEGRKGGCSDTGDIDLVSKISKDGGATWGRLTVVWDDSINTCGNPAPVVDRITGEILLLSTWNLGQDHEAMIIEQTSIDTRHVFVLKSTDNGHTWNNPKEITSTVKKPEWTWYATGPGSGIQLRESHPDRLMIACDHIEAVTRKYYSHVIYSDDHGDSWRLGGSTPEDQVNECEVAELPGGKLLLNMRNYDSEMRFRQSATSSDGGISWTNQMHEIQLPEPICQASLQSYGTEDPALLFFSNPASTNQRVDMTLRVSRDAGRNWTDSLLLHSGPAAYSDLVIVNKNTVGCLFESGEENPYEQIIFQRIAMD